MQNEGGISKTLKTHFRSTMQKNQNKLILTALEKMKAK